VASVSLDDRIPMAGRGDAAFPIIVFSHLRWDFVWQRPQQILSRLAAAHPVLFVEEPTFVEERVRSRLELSEPHPGVTRAVPVMAAARARVANETVRGLLRMALGRGGALEGRFQEPVAWYYTPMAAPAMLGVFAERAVVYDCMDELSQFRFAPPELVENEQLLMRHADLVFTGGHALHRAKSRHHDNVHFFGCGVEVEHFARARDPHTPIAADIASMSGPVLGYFGVIDERLDYDLIAALAAARGDWSLAMVGPVVKMDPARLPQAPNIHWLGQKLYGDLPGYVKAFDLCLMPFALNEATQYINPTKTLEYMAAGKPIVSTAVADVVHNFTPVVRIARDAAEFVAAAREEIAAPNEARIAQGVAQAATHSWAAVVGDMRALVLAAARPAAARQSPARRTAAPRCVGTGAAVLDIVD
jgi:glycosyltransferase involved in cell wall biosynthesis